MRDRFASERLPAVERAEPVVPPAKLDATARAAAQAGPAAVVEAVAAAREKAPPAPAKELWVDSEYCWVVICKNHLFHRHPNIFNVHRIPLGQTDGVMPRPPIPEVFLVKCDECKKEYRYQPSKVLRYEMEPPPSFEPHALFK